MDTRGHRAGVQRQPRFLRDRAHEALGAMDQHAAAVAGQAVGGDAAAVRHARQGLERDVHDRPLRITLDLGDQAETTAVVFARGVVEAPIRVCPHRRVVVVGGTVCVGKPASSPGGTTGGAATWTE